jgi:glycosyltransferase involved in cell wall biosynthesis/GT2 family glycosyltransferase
VRVLRISHSAVVDEWRGRERAIAALGVDVALLSARAWSEGGHVVRLDPRPGEPVTGVRTIGRHPALFLYDPRPIWRTLGERWDVVDVHEEPFSLATAEVLLLRRLRGNRSPVVLYTAQNLRKRYPVPFRWFERWALRTAAGISACNGEAARIAEEKGFAGRARVIPLGIDPRRFRPDAGAPPLLPPAQSRIIVGYAGRLVAEKGLRVLFEALRRDRRLHLRIAGAGPAEDGLGAEATDTGLGSRVEFLGALGADELAGFYRSLDVLAVPSLPTATWTEQFGRVAVEAMACGVPVVSSDAGALPEVVGGAGIVVPAADAAALAEALAEAAGPRADDLRRRGFERAESCTWKAVGAAYLELYRSAARKSAPGRSNDRGVEVVIVAYGTPDLVRRALSPVRSLPVTVVDNSSMPEIAALCDELGVRYLDPGRNDGFAAGVNIALADRLAPGADVLLLNPDAVVSADDLERLHRAIRARPDLASVAPAQSGGGNSPDRVAWPIPSPGLAWLEAFGMTKFSRRPEFVIGSVLLLRAEALDQVGGFDERFFLYAEETDWAYRAHRLGWRHAMVPAAHAIHVGAATSHDPARREAHFHASQERFLRKHYGAAGWQSARIAVWIGAMARSVVLPGPRGSAARRRAALYRLGPVRVEARYSRRPEPVPS